MAHRQLTVSVLIPANQKRGIELALAFSAASYRCRGLERQAMAHGLNANGKGWHTAHAVYTVCKIHFQLDQPIYSHTLLYIPSARVHLG
jgi:hypothetical protein